MNPWGLFLLVIGFLLIVIGVKGTQSEVLSAFKGVRQPLSKSKGNPNSVLPPGLQNLS
jgi:hypothetical protein